MASNIDIISPEKKPDDFRINKTMSLADTKSILATGYCGYPRSWSTLIDKVFSFYAKPCKKDKEGIDIKDTAGINFNIFKSVSEIDLFTKLQEKEANYAAELYKNPEKPTFKYDKLKSVEVKTKKIKSIFNPIKETKEISVILRQKSYLTKECVRALFLDFDNKLPPYILPSNTIEIFDALGFNYIAYSTFSSTSDRPKYRVIIPYNDYCEEFLHNSTAELIFHILSPKGDAFTSDRIDITCLQPWRFFYVPNIPNTVEKTKDVLVHDDKHFFVSKNKDLFLDPQKCFKTLYFARQRGLKILSIKTIKNMIKEINLKNKRED